MLPAEVQVLWRDPLDRTESAYDFNEERGAKMSNSQSHGGSDYRGAEADGGGPECGRNRPTVRQQNRFA
jgi:hypothetical protein